MRTLARAETSLYLSSRRASAISADSNDFTSLSRCVEFLCDFGMHMLLREVRVIIFFLNFPLIR